MIVDAATIEVESFGKGRGLPVLLLHEGLGSVSMWRDFPARLADASGRRIIAWSRLGYGNSAPFEVPYSPDFMHREADAAERLMAQMDIERVHVFGHSDGASIALLLAARHPQLVASLILEAPHVFVEEPGLQSIKNINDTFETTGLSGRLGKYHRNARKTFHLWADAWLDPAFRGWNIEEYLPRIKCPVLAIQGEGDEYGSMAQLDAIKRQAGGPCELLKLPDCGHSPHKDQPEKVLEVVVGFVKRIL